MFIFAQKHFSQWLFCLLLLLMVSGLPSKAAAEEGSLFIVGGAMDTTLTLRMVELANVRTSGYIVVLPMASETPDTAAYYAIKLFEAVNVRSVNSMFVGQNTPASQAQLDSLQGASLIYFTGGDQNKLMQLITLLEIKTVLQLAFRNGSMIAGSSAGAAVMSKSMLTGNQLKVPEYEATFSRLQAGNLELNEGLGFLEKSVIDQHFIKRSRYNRLLSVVLEHPELKGVGIDEGTAIYVKAGRAEVIGLNQVVLVTNKKSRLPLDGLLSSTRVRLTILWAGDRFVLR